MKNVLIDFKPEFVPLVESGMKPHTIRPFRKNDLDPQPGDTLHLYSGLRTKAARLLRKEICDYTHEVTILPGAGDMHHVLFGGQPLGQGDIERLARMEGFSTATNFVKFFERLYGLPFTGLMIGWQPEYSDVTRH